MANNSDFPALGGLDGTLKSLDALSDKTRKAEREAARLTQQFSGLQDGLSAQNGKGTFVDDLNAGLQTAKEEMTGFAEISGKVADGIGTAFEGAFEKLLLSGKDFKSVLKGLEADLIRLGTKTFTSAAGQSLGGSGGLFGELAGAFFGGGGSSLASLIPGFSTGGQFTVGGATGVDQNLVPLRLTRGERVTIETPAQQRGNNAAASPAPVINMAFNISTPDAASFRLSQTQIQGEALRQAQRSLRRNG